ncbi:Similar to Histone H3 [Cotesia congregata]|uniref:Embryonic (Strongylocentrotus droebachiensis) n=1 Tax=Cotesia congregata TaxID=51543 RepID=A0A8J2HB96_COTCN|nr:Similar to Histone H3 [Cotesia congregata]
MALQEASEAYLVGLFEDTNLCAIHAKRVGDFGEPKRPTSASAISPGWKTAFIKALTPWGIRIRQVQPRTSRDCSSARSED